MIASMPNNSHSPTPWAIHRTGSNLGIKAANGKFVIRKTVNMLTIEQYRQLETDFELIVKTVNERCPE